MMTVLSVNLTTECGEFEAKSQRLRVKYLYGGMGDVELGWE